MSLKFFFLMMIFSCIEKSSELNLILDAVHPFTVNKPYSMTTEPSEITVKFKFPNNTIDSNFDKNIPFGKSQGLLHKQFLGFVFPPSIGDSDLLLDVSTKHSCKLSDGKYSFTMTPVVSSTSGTSSTNSLTESFIAYCRLDDTSSNTPLKTGVTYTFSITLSSVKILSTNFLRGVSLITTSSNNPEGVINDSVVIGSMAQYGNYITSSNKPLQMGSIVIDNTRNNFGEKAAPLSTTVIYPYSLFDMSVTLTSNTMITAVDNIISFRYPVDVVSPPNKILLIKENDDNNNGNSSYVTELTVQSFGSDSFCIKDLPDVFVFIPTQPVKIILQGWKALDNTSNLNKNLELIVYYKNTYSVLSYHSIAVFNIDKVPLLMSANHPENWDIYRNGGWPFSFSFSSLVNLPNGGWVLIQHSNALNDGPIGNRLSFIASTCDFSLFDSNTNLGSTRPFCFPLRLDHSYPINSATVPYKGSGVFFNMPFAIPANKVYTVTIWAFADNCAGTTTDPVNAVSYVVPSFQITIYKSIDASKMNESRLNSSQIAESVSTGTPFQGKCWNNRMQGTTTASPYSFDFSLLNNIKLDGGENSNMKPGLTLHREIFDWQILSQTSNSNCVNCWALNMSNSLDVSEKFIYSSNPYNRISNASYFLARFQLKRSPNAGNDLLLNYIPIPYTNANNGISNTNLLPGRLILQLSSSWFESGDAYKGGNANCYFSWGAYDGSGGIDSQKQLIYTTSGQGNNSNSNFISANVNSASQFDYNYTSLPPDNNSKITRIVSTFNPGTVNSSKKDLFWKYMTDFNKPGTNNTSAKIQIGFFTSCVKWTSKLPSIKSLYSYIDIQIQWTYIRSAQENSLGVPINNLRLIKLFPEGGVFNDFSQIVPSSLGQVNPFINHLAYGSSSTKNGVCLIELDFKNIETSRDSNANSFVLFLMFGMLIESDYFDLSANYPAAPLDNDVKAYGLQSAYSMSSDNLYTSSSNTGYINLTETMRQVNAQPPFNSSLYNGSNKSSYIFYMGSTLIFSNLKINKLTSSDQSVFIPYYCPFFVSNSTSFAMLPTLIGTWTNSISKDQIMVNRVLSYKDTQSQSFTVLLPRNPLKGNGSSYSAATGSNIATLRFSPYTSSNSNTLYVFNGTGLSTGANLNCTGFSLFLSQSITTQNKITLNTNNNSSNNVYNNGIFTKNNFYVFGKVFNKAFYQGSNNPESIQGKAPFSNSQSNFYFTGVIRPDVNSFLINNIVTLSDRMAFFCASSGGSDFNYLTNYVSSLTSFILDWNPDLNAHLSTSIEYDRSDQIFRSDPAGNIKLTFTTPSEMPVGSQIKLQANSFKSATRCGMNIKQTTDADFSYAVECDTNTGSTTSNDVTCTLPIGMSKFEVCCYSINISSSFNINSLTTSIPSVNSAYISSVIYNAANHINSDPNYYTLQIPNNDLIDITKADSAGIGEITYKHSTHEGGIGTAMISFYLPRELTRNMKITIEGDLSGLLIQHITPECSVSFSTGEGDVLIDSCSVDLKSSTPLVISTKNIVYKCGVSFNKTFNVTLTPILVINFEESNKFVVKMETMAGEDLALNTKSSTLKMVNKLDSSFTTISSQWDYLCYISSVNPRIPSELADYQFEIDLDVNKNLLSNSNLKNSLNEVTIFLPIHYYGSYQNNIICSYNSQFTPCEFIDKGILNIRFLSNLPIGSNKKIVIVVTGVMNPAVDSVIIFPCSVNNYDYVSNKRTSVIVGSGRLLGGINTSSVTINGNLIFMKPVPVPFVSDSGLRNVSTYNLRIGFDFAVGMTLSSFTITGSPILNIVFPSEYKLGLSNSKPTAKIWEYTIKGSVIAKATTAMSSSVYVSSNRLQMTIPKVNYAINSAVFCYWDIEISNILNPDIGINTSSTTTQPFHIFLLNSLGNVLFRSYTNLNSFAASPMTSPLNNFLAWNRGLTFSFNPSQWVLDVFTEKNRLNVLSIKSGRFNQAFFLLKNVKDYIEGESYPLPSVTTLTLSDPIFKTSDAKYNLSTSFTKEFGFFIGCSCNTPTATFYINFSSSEKNYFAGMIPIEVNVENSSMNKFKLDITRELTLPFNSTAWVFIKPSDLNFDPLNINWKTNANNDPNSILSNIVIPSNTSLPQFSLFNLTSNNIPNTNQIFTLDDPNQCFTSSRTLNITITDDHIPNINDFYYRNSFKYYNSDTDPNLNEDKTSIKFKFTPPISPIYMFCALVCKNNLYPIETAIMTSNKTLNTNLLQYYGNFFNATKTVDIIFNNLIRGLKYKMKCIIQSTEALIEERRRVDMIFENDESGEKKGYYDIGGLIREPGKNDTINSTINTADNSSNITDMGDSNILTISPSKSEESSCVRLDFTSQIDITTKIAIINYCQRLFSANGFFENGCIICTSSQGNYTSPGLTVPSNYYCGMTRGNPLTLFNRNSRLLQTNTQTTSLLSYSICMIPDPSCKTNLPYSTTSSIISTFLTNLNSTESTEKHIKIPNVPIISNNNSLATPIYKDDKTPDISEFQISNITAYTNGTFSWVASYNTTQTLQCYWRVLGKFMNAPTADVIRQCNDLSWCGNHKLQRSPFMVNPSLVKSFAGRNYKVYYVCYNDVPAAYRNSEVIMAGNFILEDNDTENNLENSGDVNLIEYLYSLMFIFLIIA